MNKNNKNVLKKFVKEFKNQGNHAIVDKLFTENFVHYFQFPGISQDREGLKQIGKMVSMSFPDVHVTIEDIIAEGDRVVERSTATATHSGEFMGIPSTNKQVKWGETHVYRFEEGKIAELWPQLDVAGLMAQLKP